MVNSKESVRMTDEFNGAMLKLYELKEEWLHYLEEEQRLLLMFMLKV